MPNDLIVFALGVLAGFFAIMNPVANTPIFLGLTEGIDERDKRRIAKRSTLVAFLIVAVFSVAGNLIFDLFGLTLPAFRITGGILVFLVGLQMMHGQTPKAHAPLSDTPDAGASVLSIATSPLAIPILAGPGTIATAMHFVAGGSMVQVAITVGVFAVMCLVTCWAFVWGGALIGVLGKEFISVVSRIMGLIVGVIGTQMVVEGIDGAIEAYASV